MTTSLTIYSYSRCSTCRRAVSWLRNNNILFEEINIIDKPPQKELLKKAFDQIGNRKKLFNTSGQSYRSLGASTVTSMSDDEALEALASDGKLIKRPFLITQECQFILGFNQEEWAKVLL